MVLSYLDLLQVFMISSDYQGGHNDKSRLERQHERQDFTRGPLKPVCTQTPIGLAQKEDSVNIQIFGFPFLSELLYWNNLSAPDFSSLQRPISIRDATQKGC